MTLEFSVDPTPSSFGNHFILGLSGFRLSDSDKRILAAIRPAGILLSGRSFEHESEYPQWHATLTALIESVRQYTERYDLLVSIDHESARVHRTPPPLTAFPDAITFGGRAALVAKAQAIELRSLGVNVSWAPVADIHSNPLNPVIGNRAFGHTPDEVIGAAVPYLTELMQQGVLGCAKHFPGHGDTATDSHLELPSLDLTREALKRRELVPFKALIEAGVPFVMTAHILFPAIDPTTPATMSRYFIDELLRKELGYEKVVVADDLEMKAVSAHFEHGNTISHAVNVGCDMFIVARHPGSDDERTMFLAKSMVKGLEERIVSQDTLFRSFCRINDVFENSLPDNEPHLLGPEVFAAHAELSREIERK